MTDEPIKPPPCPFCGWDAEQCGHRHNFHGREYRSFRCSNGDCFLSGVDCIAEGTWNRRVAPDPAANAPEPVLTAAEAMAVLSKAMKEDEGYAISWCANLAMLAYDAGANHVKANETARSFMWLAFGVDMSYYKPELASMPVKP